MDGERTAKAIRECAQWLAICREKMAWSQEYLDKLEALWWKYRKPNGEFIPRTELPPPPADDRVAELEGILRRVRKWFLKHAATCEGGFVEEIDAALDEKGGE